MLTAAHTLGKICAAICIEYMVGGAKTNIRQLPPPAEVFLTFLFLFSEFYENYAVMMEEEGTVIVGLLVGLNVIDANLCVKGEDLDSQVCYV